MVFVALEVNFIAVVGFIVVVKDFFAVTVKYFVALVGVIVVVKDFFAVIVKYFVATDYFFVAADYFIVTSFKDFAVLIPDFIILVVLHFIPFRQTFSSHLLSYGLKLTPIPHCFPHSKFDLIRDLLHLLLD